MTLIKSSIPLTVYRAESPLLANITGDAIRRFAFRSIDNVPEEKACGFVNCDDMFDTEWINSIPEKGHYMAFGFRVDVRRIAPAILKKHVAAKVREERRNPGALQEHAAFQNGAPAFHVWCGREYVHWSCLCRQHL